MSRILNDQGCKTMIIHPCLLGKVLFYAYHLYQKYHLIFKSVLVGMVNYMVILYTTQPSNGWKRLIISLYERLMIMKDCWIGKEIIPIFYVPFLMRHSGPHELGQPGFTTIMCFMECIPYSLFKNLVTF